MSKKDLGILIYHEWLSAMEGLSAKDVKALLMAMRDFQVRDLPPPQFKGSANVLASVIFPSIERRKKLSDYGKRGMEARYSSQSEASVKKTDGEKKAAKERVEISESTVKEADNHPDIQPVSHPDILPVSHPVSHPEPNSIENDSIEYQSIDEQSKETFPSVTSERSEDDAPQSPYASELKIIEESLSEEERRDLYPERYGDTRAYTDKDVKYTFGKYLNVFLTVEEYDDIKSRIRNADGYIDTFSAKLYTRGYRYPDHYRAILDWWERDSNIEDRKNEAEVNCGESGDNGRDWDAFFEAAVRRSLGDRYEGAQSE